MPAIPLSIKKEHVLKAIEEIDKTGIPLERESKSYSLLFNNKEYPPKYVICIANKYASSEELVFNYFNSLQAVSYLENLGLTINRKKSVISQYWLIRAGSGGRLWDEWKEKSIITIGWNIGENLRVLNKDEIKERIKEWNYDSDPDKAAGLLRSFASIHDHEDKIMNKGDYIIVLGDASIEGIAEIIGDKPYIYSKEGLQKEKTHTYWKKVNYIFKNGPIWIRDLPAKFRQGGENPIHLVATLKRFEASKENFNELIDLILRREGGAFMTDIIEKIKEIIEYSNQINEYKEDPDYFLEAIKKLPKNHLQERREYYKNQHLKKNGYNSVNTVRYIILDKILKDKSVDIEMIEAIKQNIRYKNDDYFSDYSEIQKAVSNLERKGKNYFQSWSNFSILMQIFYDRDKERINDFLNDIGAFIQKEAIPKELNYYYSDFMGNNNFGRDSCWIVFYPQTCGNFKDCYQLIVIFQPFSIEYGIAYGSNVKKVKTDRETLQFKDFDFINFKNDLRKFFPRFYELNSGIVEPPLPPEPEGSEELTSLTLYKNTDINIERIVIALKLNYQIILMGPPGTSKSYIAKQIANSITEDDNKITLVQFHPEYSYDDFVEGKEPIGGEQLSLEFKPVRKKFVKICEAAKKSDENYVLILDEINRGNVEKIFGELIWALENRGQAIELLYSRKPLIIPKNLFLIGTMNTVDLSIANIDAAIRRRFFIIELMPDGTFLENWLKYQFKDRYPKIQERIVKLMHDINLKIKNSERINEYQSIGHTYFMMVKGETIEEKWEYLKMSWEFSIKPLLLEYYQFNKDDIEEYLDLWDKFEEDINQYMEEYQES